MAINFNSVDLYKYTEEEFLVIKKIIPYSIVRHAFIYHNIKGQDYNNLDLKPIYYEDLILPMEKNMILMILKELLRKHLLDNIEYDDEKVLIAFNKIETENVKELINLLNTDEFVLFYLLKECTRWFDNYSYPIKTSSCTMPYVKKNILPYYFKTLIEKGFLDCACVDNNSIYPNYIIRGVTFEGRSILKQYSKTNLDDNIIQNTPSINSLILKLSNNDLGNYSNFIGSLYLSSNEVYNNRISYKEEDGINIPVIEANVTNNGLRLIESNSTPLFCDFARDDNPYSYIDYVKLLRKKGGSTLVYSYCLKNKNRVHGFIFNKDSFDGDYKSFDFYKTNMISLYFKLIVDLNPKFNLETSIIYGMMRYKGLNTKIMASKYGVSQMAIEKVIDRTYESREGITLEILYNELDITPKFIDRIKNSIFEKVEFEDI